MNFGIVDDFICDIDANGNVIDKVCEAVYVEKRLVNLLTWEIKCLITLIVRGNRITFPVKRADLLNGLPNELFAKGLSLANDKEVREAVHILILDTEMDAPDEFFHEKLGFCEVQDKLVFLANKPIGQLSAPQDSSEYKDPETGNADKVKPHGSFDAWLDLVRSEVLGHPNMELALLIGLSAPVAYILREKLRLFQEIPIWSIIGESSSGKTTALRVMASPFGSPEESTGLIKDVNATQNAFFRSLSDATGLPLIVDEVTAQPLWNFTAMIYSLSKGQDKSRCRSSGGLQERVGFSGVIVFSGENSLFAQGTQNLGTHARMTEITLPWTDSADHAERLSKGFRKNYGHAVAPFIEKLLEIFSENPKKLEILFERELEILLAMAGNVSSVEKRIFNAYATVLVAAEVAKKALRLNFDVTSVRKVLIENFKKKASELSPEDKFYDALMDFVVTHYNNFPKKGRKGQNATIPTASWGEITSKGLDKVVWITKETLKKFAEGEGVVNYIPILRKLFAKGIVYQFEGDRYCTGYTIAGIEVPCYCFKIKGQTPTTKKVKKKKRNNSEGSQINLLLEDEIDEEMNEKALVKKEPKDENNELNDYDITEVSEMEETTNDDADFDGNFEEDAEEASADDFNLDFLYDEEEEA